MSTHRRSSASRTRFWVGVVAAGLLLALALSFLLANNARTSERTDAESRAARYVTTVLAPELTPEDVSKDILGSDYRILLIPVQAGIMSDDRVAGVRIWRPDGDLIFSTAQRDEIETFVATDDPLIGAAAGGDTVSEVEDAVVAPRSGLEGSNEKVLETYVPLRLSSEVTPSAVAQIDTRYSAIEAAATRVWRPVQIALIVALGVLAVILGLSLRAAPEVSTVAVSTAEPAERGAERLVAAGDDRRIRDAEARAAAAERAAREAETRLAEAERRLADASSVEIPPNVMQRLDDLENKLRTEAAERERFASEALRLRSALTQKDAELTLMQERRASSDADAARIGELVSDADRLVEEAGARATDAERRAEELATRLAEADRRTLELEGRLRGTEDLRRSATEAEALQGRVEGAEAALAAVSSRLAEREGTTADLESRQAAATGEIDDLRARLAAVEAERDLARGDRQSAARDRDAIRVDRDELAAERDALRLERDGLNDQRATARAEAARLERELETTRAEVDRIRRTADSASTELEKARAEARASAEENAKVRTEMDELRTELARVRTESATGSVELERARTDAAMKAAELRKTRDDATAKIAELQNVRAGSTSMRSELEASRAEASAAKTELQRSKTELQRSKADFERLRRELDLMASEVERITSETPAAAGAASPEAERRITELERTVRDLEAQRRRDVQELQRAQGTLANTEADLVRTTRKLKDAQDRIRELEREAAGAREPVAVGAPEPSAPPDALVGSDVAGPVAGSMSSFAARLSTLRQQISSHIEEAAGLTSDNGEEVPSLRERLASAAEARQREGGTE